MSKKPKTAKAKPIECVDEPPVSMTHKADSESAYDAIDRSVHAAIARTTSGIAPSVLAEAWTDWTVHLAASPGKQLQLANAAVENAQKLWMKALSGRIVPSDAIPDRRLTGEAWQTYPFNLWAQAHLLNWAWWQDATKGVHGVASPHEDLMAFVAGQIVDAAAPSNFPLTNPEVLQATLAEGGQNFVRGAKTLMDDVTGKKGTSSSNEAPEFEVGRNLATTPGKVVFQNDLIELI